MAQQRPNVEEHLSDEARARLTLMIDKNGQTDPQVRAICVILKNAIELPVEEIHDNLIEMLPVDVLYVPPCFIDHRIFSCVRAVLTESNVTMPRDRSTMVSIKVARALYTDKNDADEACDLVEAFRLSRRPSAAPANASGHANHITIPNLGSSSNRETSAIGRNKATVAASFKDEDKYIGSISGRVPLHRIKNRFLDALHDQCIPKTDEVNLLHCCLSGMALDFYYKSIRGICQTVEEAFKSLEKHFNSFQHQAQARTYLKNLSIEAVMKEKECSPMVALEIIHNRITETAPNCGQEYQHYVHYCDFLEGTVIGQPWAHTVIQERLCPSPNERYDYNTFYSKLCAALTSYETTHKTDLPTDLSTVTAATFFGERYASNPRRNHRNNASRYHRPGQKLNVASMLRPPNRIKNRMSASQLAQLKSRTKCLRCHEIGHWRHECHNKSKNPMKEVLMTSVAQLGNDETAVAKTLWALMEDDEEYDAYVNFCNDDDRQIAQTLTPPDTGVPSNTFHALLDSLPANLTYTDQHASEKLEDMYSKFSNAFSGDEECDSGSSFGLPM